MRHYNSGTVEYWPPERFVRSKGSERFDPRSKATDLYAYGVIMWEVATPGKWPWETEMRQIYPDDDMSLEDKKEELKALVCQEEPSQRPGWLELAAEGGGAAGYQSPSEVPSARYKQLTARCWAHKKEDRPSFGEVASCVEEILAEVGVARGREAYERATWNQPARLPNIDWQSAPGGVGRHEDGDPTGEAARWLMRLLRGAKGNERFFLTREVKKAVLCHSPTGGMGLLVGRGASRLCMPSFSSCGACLIQQRRVLERGQPTGHGAQSLPLDYGITLP